MAIVDPNFPHVRTPLLNSDGTASRPYYVWFQQTSADLLQAKADITALQAGEGGGSGNVIGNLSVASAGALPGIVTLSLVNDSGAPGNHYRYGTDGNGTKGWQSVLSDFAATANITVAALADGTVTFNLTPITPTAGGTLQKYGFDAYGRMTQQGAATTDNLAEGVTNLYFTNARADARITLQKGVANGLATLDSGGKVPVTQLPAIVVNETYVVNSQAAMLALAANVGDTCVRTDISETFILQATPASTLSNWIQLLSPTTGVASFNGRTGTVLPLTGDYTFAMIGSKPTTLSGYGITDGVPATRTVSAGTGLTGGGALSANITLSLANRGASTLMGNPTASSAAPTDITIGTGLSLSVGGVLTATGTGGTVTSIGITVPTQFAVTPATITTSGTFAITWNNQVANTVLAGPSSGANAAPTFRALVGADIASALPTDTINGLKLSWVSTSSISIGTGEAVIPSTGKLETVTAAISITGIALGASTFGHVYLYDNAGTPSAECVTTAPAAPYRGTARAKTGDTTRRYLGSVLTDASGNLWFFQWGPGNRVSYGWGNSGGPPQRVLTLGMATTATTVSCSASIPVTATHVTARFQNTDTTQGTRVANSAIPGATGATGAGTNFLFAAAPASAPVLDTAVDGGQALLYWFVATPTGAMNVDIFGYLFER